MRAKKKKKVDWAQIIYNSLCSELVQWYKYVKDNKQDKKDTCQSTMILAKILKCLFVHQKENPKKPQAKVKRIREEMQATLENKRKAPAKFLRSGLKRKKVEPQDQKLRNNKKTYKHGLKR
jgi:hypothetical protein